jgi:hypothetical protein
MAKLRDLTGDTYGLDYQGGDGWGPSYEPSSSGSDFSSPLSSGLDHLAQTAPTVPTKRPAAAPQQGYEDFGSSFMPQSSGAASTSEFDTGPVVDPVEHDRIARQTYTDLKNAGHDVKWQGDQLMVDGRAYEFGNALQGGQDSGSGFDDSPAPTPPAPPIPTDAGYPTDFGGGNVDQQHRQIEDTYGVGAPEGYDAGKWADRNHQSDKYLAGHIQAAGGSIDDVVHALNARTPGWKKISSDAIEAPDGSRFDLRRDSSGVNAIQWLQIAGPGGRPLGGSAGDGAGAQSYDGTPSDFPKFSWEQLLAELEKDPSATGLDALVRDIQAHPTSLDEHAVGTMKAQLKDTLAEQQQFEDQNLKGLGASYGISESPWLASERLSSDRSKNQAIASGNANIDIQAAQTRAADKRAAAGVGVSYQNLRGARLASAVAQDLQRAGIKLDYARLAQQDDQFLRDLAYRLKALEQADAQFAATHPV